MALTGVDLASSIQSAALAADIPGAVATAGLHPHYASDWSEETGSRIRELVKSGAARAVGECGLDFDRMRSSRAAQEQALMAQIALAQDLGAPIFLHERDASARMLEILDAAGPLPPAVIHCFTGDRAALESYLARGLHIGVTGWICDERRGAGLRDLVALIPAGRLMIETDAPYLYPRSMPWPGPALKPSKRRNEPSFLPHIAAEIADARGESPAELAAHTTETARRFFGLDGALD